MSQPAQQPDPSPDSPGEGREESEPFTITMPDDPASERDWYLWAAVLALIALVAFWPAINGTFIWDDDHYVTQNRALLDASGLKQIWRIPPGTIQYYPLTFTAFWIEHQFWANNSLGYRVVNLLLHAGAAVVLWRILRRLSIPGAWAAAALWAVHPLQTESVCWISECKNVLSGVLALGSALFYLEFAGLLDPDSKNRAWNLTEDWQPYAVSVGLFVLAMLAKTAVLFVPVALLVVLWWKKRLTWPRALGTAPMLFIGAALAWETSKIETDPNGAIAAYGPEWQLSFIQRLLISGRDFWFYIGKLLMPIHQSFVYARIVPLAGDGGQWLFIIAALTVLVALTLAIARIGRGPLTALICYVLILFPALGFANVYPFRFSFVADHFQYLAGIPLIVLAVGIAAKILSPLWERQLPGEPSAAKPSSAIAVLVSLLLVVLGTASWLRADVFSEPAKLWEDALQDDKDPDSWLAAFNLAIIRQSQASDMFEDAAALLQNRDETTSAQEAHDALDLLDQSDQLLHKVVNNAATPQDVLYKAYNQMAENDITRMRSPDTDAGLLMQQALVEAQTALTYGAAQRDPLPYYTLGLINLNRTKLMQKTLPPTTRSSPPATTRPNSPQEQQFVDLALEARGDFRKSIDLAEAQLDSPTVGPEALRVLPLAAYQSGKIDWLLASLAHDHGDGKSESRYGVDAAKDYSLSVKFNPNSVDGRFQLALALENVGDLDDARNQLIIILRDLDHFNAAAYNEIGRVILESRPTDMSEFEAAVQSFKDALKLDPNLPGAKENLALAMKMLASTRPTTRTQAAPATSP